MTDGLLPTGPVVDAENDAVTAPVDAWIGLGANLGDIQATLASALRAVAALPDSQLIRVSSHYRSAPVLAQGPDFVNAVALVRTTLAPLVLLDHLQSIEAAHGRERPYLNAPRRLDLDLLLYGNRRMVSSRLTLPHPRAHLRAFVLAPLCELAPGLVLPDLGPVSTLLAACDGQRCERIAGP